MKSGRVNLLEKAGCKGPIFERQTSRKPSSILEEVADLDELGKLPFLSQKSGNLVYENTYKMLPDKEKRFSSARVKAISDTILHEMLCNVDYDPKACRELSLSISDAIVRQVTSLGFNRYKIVCLTTIGQKMEQAVRIASQCCWDPKVDNFAESVFVNRSLFAVSVVYGLYQE